MIPLIPESAWCCLTTHCIFPAIWLFYTFSFSFKLLCEKNFIRVLLIYNVMLISGVSVSFSKVSQLYIHPLVFRFFSHIGHCRALSRVPMLHNRSLLTICLFLGVCIYQLPSPNLSLFHPYPSITLSLLSASVIPFLILSGFICDCFLKR